MTDKPATPTPTKYLNAALAVLFGTIAIYLTIELLRTILVPLAVGVATIVAVWVVWTWKRRPPSTW